MTATLEHIAVGGNRHSSAADWAASLLAFGAGNNIALWNPDDEGQKGVTALLTGHTDHVHAVKIFEHDAGRTIISGGADKTIRTWTPSKENATGFRESHCLTEHTGSINALAILPQNDLFASGSADATVKIWQLQGTTAKLVQSISLKPHYLPLALALTSLPNGDVVLAVAGTFSGIQLFVRTNSSSHFSLQATLTGHEGWIRSLDFTKESQDPSSDILLASASQDKYIRLWRFHRGLQARKLDTDITTELATDTAAKKSLSNKAHQVGSFGAEYAVTFEALLVGHEDWVYTVRWRTHREQDGSLALLSASADNSLSIWHADEASGLWVCSSRLGEISSQKGSTTATGSAGGFWIGLWQPSGRSVVSLGRTGSWRRWTFDQTSDMWLQGVGISGHVGEVQGLAWSPCGSYLLSTSSDQTTRLLTEWRRGGHSSWHEMSRPQIHGYDLNCIDTISENRFISGADEKLLRVFDKPKAVDALVSKLSGAARTVSEDLPDAANIPVLGLSNKAMAAADDDEQTVERTIDGPNGRDEVDPASIVRKSTLDLDQPPFEDHLARHTLWPEHEKLYGHGYEISAVATSNNGLLVATACKASSLDHAVIRLYETGEYREVKPPLSAHGLTVTSLAFSPDDRFLLSVGRDRQWAVFQRSQEAQNDYKLYCSNPKGHSRMILDCSWAPIHAENVFATAGRDRTVKIWRLSDSGADCITTVSSQASVTAVAFEHNQQADTLTLAYGTEAGSIVIVLLDVATLAVREQKEMSRDLHPSQTVNALRWRHQDKGQEVATSSKHGQLASASDDGSVGIYNIA